MSNTDTVKTYILQKDLPNAKAGTEFTLVSTGVVYSYDSNNGDKSFYWSKDIENNPEWFLPKQQEKERIGISNIFRDHSSSDKNPNNNLYCFLVSKEYPKIKIEQYTLIKQAIESILNNEEVDKVEEKQKPENDNYVFVNELSKLYDNLSYVEKLDIEQYCKQDGIKIGVRPLEEIRNEMRTSILDQMKELKDKHDKLEKQKTQPVSTIKEDSSSVLFVTEDGVNVFENDKYWYVINHTPVEVLAFPNCTYGDKDNVKYFSTKDAAEEYVLMNKPQLSIQDVMNRLEHYIQDKRNALSNLKYFITSKNA